MLRVEQLRERIAQLEQKGRDSKSAKHELEAMESTQRTYEREADNIARQVQDALLDTAV